VTETFAAPRTDLREQTALVTGGSGGIGGAIAEALAAAGAAVTLSYHTNRIAAES
jgi:NAD(P)-dependent dehydrogenase (short-subunit alcohol dehydrogenase family)